MSTVEAETEPIIKIGAETSQPPEQGRIANVVDWIKRHKTGRRVAAAVVATSLSVPIVGKVVDYYAGRAGAKAGHEFAVTAKKDLSSQTGELSDQALAQFKAGAKKQLPDFLNESVVPEFIYATEEQSRVDINDDQIIGDPERIHNPQPSASIPSGAVPPAQP